MTKYFTVKTIDFSGLTDQLATQFSRLYCLGYACQYEYVYTPFSFPRSHGYTFNEKLIMKINKLLFFALPWLYHLQFFRKSMTKFFSLLYLFLHKIDFSKKNRDEEIINFIGFSNFENQISDNKFNNYELLSIDLHEILESNKITDICQLKDILDGISSSSSLIYEFVWTEKMHSFLPTLDYLLNKIGLESLEFSNRKLSENYWKVSKENLSYLASFNNEKINLVAHLRLGDSVAIHLANKTLYVIGDCVFSTDIESDIQSMKEIFDIDPTRKAINLHQYEIILNKIFQTLGRENTFCSILSDGYEITFDVIISSLTKGKLKLSTTELQELKHIEKVLNDDLNSFISKYSDTSIVGESFDNFLKSIHTLASAELVIWGTGGFAFNTHKLFKKHNHFSSIIHVTKHKYEVFKEISALK